jgi:hypothetical protein
MRKGTAELRWAVSKPWRLLGAIAGMEVYLGYWIFGRVRRRSFGSDGRYVGWSK